MIDLRYKAQRIQRWTPVVGLFEAIKFEFLWSLRFLPVSVRVPGYPKAFRLRRWDSDLSVFETVFVERELDAYLPKEPRSIVDGGANIGLTTAFYARYYPHALVVAVEPSSENCSLLKHNCDRFSNISVLEGGLWVDSGFLRLANPDAKSWAFKCEPAQQETEGAFPAYSIERVIELAGTDRCDLIKLDIEGAEEYLFASGAERWLPKVDAILVEVHGEKADKAIREACSEKDFEYNTVGEKLLLVRRDSIPPNN